MHKILVVDDDRDMGRLLQTLFEMEGYQVIVVSQYDRVLPGIRDSAPDIVLMDVRVQGEETVALMEQISADDDLRQLPVIMTSGMNFRQECLAAGAARFVLKPFLPNDMVNIVRQLLN